MGSKNVLIALAYIKESDNPFDVFCNFIMYCFKKNPNKPLTNDCILREMQDEFGLIMPNNIISICIRMLKKQKKVKIENGVYKLCDACFDIENFNKERILLKKKEEELIDNLRTYVKKYKKEWTFEECRENLTKFLVDDENASNLFLNGTIKNEKYTYVSNNWYIGKYITELLELNNANKDNLIDIVKGLMIYFGAFQTQDFKQKFCGTNFYIDTKLLLRAMGYSWELEVQSAIELLELITKEYGGNICVFEHTIGEIENALSTAAENLKNGIQINDLELRMYVDLKKVKSFELELASESVRRNIEMTFNCHIQPNIDWNSERCKIFNIAWEDLTKYLCTKHPNWKEAAILNDIRSINNINILRKGDYSEYYGGKKKLPVFITSNSALVYDIKKYTKEKYENSDINSDINIDWNLSAMPIVTDYMMMCRLWLPKAKTLVSIPTLVLARNAYAAQRLNSPFFDRIKVAANELSKQFNIDIIDLSDARKIKIEEFLIRDTSGNVDEMTPTAIANSIDELVKLETINLNNSIDELKVSNDILALTIEKQKQYIIKSATDRFVFKLPLRFVFIYIIQFWWLESAFLFAIINYLISKPLFVFSLVSIILKIAEKCLNNPAITNKLKYIAVNSTWKKYKENVKSNLNDFEKEYENDILESSKEIISIFCKNKNLIKDKNENKANNFEEQKILAHK